MFGFDDKALILFPSMENYEHKPGMYKYQFKKAVNNLCAYLKDKGIEPHVFYTDDVAREIRHPDFKYVSTLSTADKFFISKYCDNASDALTLSMIEFPDLYNKITADDSGSKDMNVEQRFSMVLRHINKAVCKIIPTYKIVIHFVVKNKAQYKVTSKPGDGKIRIDIGTNTFTPTVYIGGMEENPVDLLGVPYANRGLDLWESVDNVGN